LKIKITKIKESSYTPVYSKDMDVGADIPIPEDIILEPGINVVPLGISIEIPHGFEGQLRSRTGCLLDGIVVCNPPIDPGYTGEISVFIHNVKDHSIICEKGDRLCQLVIKSFIRAEFVPEIINDRKDSKCNSSGRGL